jgi:hypothetical protein
MHAVRNVRRWAAVVVDLLSSLLLVFLPVPLGPLHRKLVGRKRADGSVEFYSHPRVVCTSHLIWTGWLLAGVELYNRSDWAEQGGTLATAPFCWLWLLTLVFTILVLGLQFGRVPFAFVGFAAVIVVLLVCILDLATPLAPFKNVYLAIAHLPVTISWGVPLLTSLVLGLVFAAVATWQSWDDRWILPACGNYIEHVNFQQKDRNIPKGAKNFAAVFNCLVRRYLLFGYGDIEVRSSSGKLMLYRIEGVFFAAWHADLIKRRISSVDVSLDEHEDELEGELLDH